MERDEWAEQYSRPPTRVEEPHDPLCPTGQAGHPSIFPCGYCALIRGAKQVERESIIEGLLTQMGERYFDPEIGEFIFIGDAIKIVRGEGRV